MATAYLLMKVEYIDGSLVPTGIGIYSEERPTLITENPAFWTTIGQCNGEDFGDAYNLLMKDINSGYYINLLYLQELRKKGDIDFILI